MTNIKLDDLLKKKKTWGQLARFISKIENIIKSENKEGQGKLKEKIRDINSESVFFEYPVVYIPPNGELILIGDTHGDSESVIAILKKTDFINRANNNEKVYLVFTGDYADRGKQDIKNIELLLNLKENFPEQVYLLRGNHEEVNMGQHYGLLGSCIARFGYERGQFIFQRLNEMFEKFPVVMISGNGVVAVHGGVPISDIKSLKDLNDEDNLTDIRWNDPTEEIENFIYNYRRGSNYLFGRKTFNSFMKGIGANVLFRSHEYVAKGHKFLFDHRLVSVFSNGGESKESGFKDFILKPKYVHVKLDQPIKQWTSDNVIDIDYD